MTFLSILKGGLDVVILIFLRRIKIDFLYPLTHHNLKRFSYKLIITIWTSLKGGKSERGAKPREISVIETMLSEWIISSSILDRSLWIRNQYSWIGNEERVSTWKSCVLSAGVSACSQHVFPVKYIVTPVDTNCRYELHYGHYLRCCRQKRLMFMLACDRLLIVLFDNALVNNLFECKHIYSMRVSCMWH